MKYHKYKISSKYPHVKTLTVEAFSKEAAIIIYKGLCLTSGNSCSIKSIKKNGDYLKVPKKVEFYL